MGRGGGGDDGGGAGDGGESGGGSGGGYAGSGGSSGGVTTTMVGGPSTMIPRSVLVAAADEKLEERALLTDARVVYGGTAMVATMMTLPAVMVTVTCEAFTPAACAIVCFIDAVSL
jgi:hypothetical protein